MPYPTLMHPDYFVLDRLGRVYWFVWGDNLSRFFHRPIGQPVIIQYGKGGPIALFKIKIK